MTDRQRRTVLGIIAIILGILALSFVIIGLYIRLFGTRNPTGVVYIYVGGVLALGGWVATTFVSRSKKK